MDTRGLSVIEAVTTGQVKALSLWQAWATVLVSPNRPKKIETRSWSTEYRGWLLIQASKMVSPDVRYSIDRSRDIFHDLYGDIARDCTDGKWIGPVFVPTGCIVGAVRLDDVVTTEELVDGLFGTVPETELSWGDFSPDRHGWLTSCPIAFRRPIPCKGRQGLFELDPELRDRVLAELGAARQRECEQLSAEHQRKVLDKSVA